MGHHGNGKWSLSKGMGKSDLSSATFLLPEEQLGGLPSLREVVQCYRASLLPPAIPEKGEGPLGYSLVSHLLD